MLERIRLLLQISHTHHIARRYFVVNGFDGALTMLGICVAFYGSGTAELTTIIGACLGAAVALGISGITSAYISEAAERRKELQELEQAMFRDLSESAPGQAARFAPWLIALVNGLAPFFISLLIIAPLWLTYMGWLALERPLLSAIVLTFIIIFFLGLFIGRISGTFWLWAGLRTLLIALATGGLITLLT